MTEPNRFETKMTPEEFRAAFNKAINDNDLSEREVLDRVETSKLTLRRWMSGVSAPHRFLYATILRFINEPKKPRVR